MHESLQYTAGQNPVKIEELLQIFVDHPDQLRSFLEKLIRDHNSIDFKQLHLTDINLHHRLLECYLYANQTIDTKLTEAQFQSSSDLHQQKQDIKKSINDFLKTYESSNKVDKNYVLFLFQIYQYNDGVRDCC